jgi:hypothetical protein
VTTMREFLDALSAELTARGVPHDLIGSQPEAEPGAPPYIAVSDQDGHARRIRVHPAYYWYYWGSDLEDRWSVLRPDITAEVIAGRALQTGWPDSPEGELTLPLWPDNH